MQGAEVGCHISIHFSFISVGVFKDTLGVLPLNGQVENMVIAKCVLG